MFFTRSFTLDSWFVNFNLKSFIDKDDLNSASFFWKPSEIIETGILANDFGPH